MQRLGARTHGRKENTRASARKSTILVVAVESRNLNGAPMHAEPGTATSVLRQEASGHERSTPIGPTRGGGRCGGGGELVRMRPVTRRNCHPTSATAGVGALRH